MRCDVVIIGSGVAGLSLAIKLAMAKSDIQVVVVSKVPFTESNSAHAQGGIAAAMDSPKDSAEYHFKDTMQSGGGRSAVDSVRILTNEIPKRIEELMAWGMKFDLNSDGSLHLGLEGGHSHHRIVHHKDQTGLELMQSLRLKLTQFRNITLLENYKAISLLKGSGEKMTCHGAVLFDLKTRKTFDFVASTTVLATGGCGQLFRYTTNPTASTGDGIALAYELGADISNMQYIQFHPTTLYEPESGNNFLITEALRGHGAHILNLKEERFLFKYDPRGELATRDIVSQAIYSEMEATGGDYVWLDLRHLKQHELENEFPFVMNKIKSIGLNPSTELIPIAPAAHYQCGGISTSIYGETTIPGLYALGECANNGLHGTNRLASNSLAEGLVFSELTCRAILNRPSFSEKPQRSISEFRRADPSIEIQNVWRKKLKDITYSTFLKKNDAIELQMGLITLSTLADEAQIRFSGSPFHREFQLMCTSASIILKQCLESKPQEFLGESLMNK